MRYASLRGYGLLNNVVFDISSSANRDNCFAPYALLRLKFQSACIQLDTSDQSLADTNTFELHLNIQQDTRGIANYLLMLETELVEPANGNATEWEKYRKIFTWNDDLVDGDRFIKINFPNPVVIPAIDGWGGRHQFCCLISGNKTLKKADERDLYQERVMTIRWFENYAPQDFNLYGIDWNMPVMPAGRFGSVLRRLWRGLTKVVKLRPFPSYVGRVENKSDVLKHVRYAICYENVRDLPGYITEKIFDCFFSGCVPVYWGASNVSDYIPEDCFIDRRQFADTEAVYNYIKNITEEEFLGYQERIAAFLQSDAAYQFSSEFFAETIVNTIVHDIGT
jgi:hypothetical protein